MDATDSGVLVGGGSGISEDTDEVGIGGALGIGIAGMEFDVVELVARGGDGGGLAVGGVSCVGGGTRDVGVKGEGEGLLDVLLCSDGEETGVELWLVFIASGLTVVGPRGLRCGDGGGVVSDKMGINKATSVPSWRLRCSLTLVTRIDVASCGIGITHSTSIFMSSGAVPLINATEKQGIPAGIIGISSMRMVSRKTLSLARARSPSNILNSIVVVF